MMSNHNHLVISVKGNNIIDVPGDFRKFTSKQLMKTIIDHPGGSRREWMIGIFKRQEKLIAETHVINSCNRLTDQE